MNSLGSKIRKLRTQANLSQIELAEKIGCSAKSIQRYENNCYPDSYTLKRIADFFGVSIDFLLEADSMIIRKERNTEAGLYRLYHEEYLRCKHNFQIDSNSEYYWIYLDDDDTYGGQSMWVGWADEDKKIEIRKLRPVIPQNAIETCTRTCGKPMIINNEAEAAVFLLFGGHAIVRADVCREFLYEFFEEYVGPNPEQWIIDMLCR